MIKTSFNLVQETGGNTLFFLASAPFSYLMLNMAISPYLEGFLCRIWMSYLLSNKKTSLSSTNGALEISQFERLISV